MTRGRRGSTLLVAMVALVVVAIAAQAIHGVLVRSLHGMQDERRSVQLRALTDAALAATLANLSGDPSARKIPRRRLADGYLESAVRDHGSGLLEVLASGEIGGRRATARALVSLDPPGPHVVSWEPSVVVAAP